MEYTIGRDAQTRQLLVTSGGKVKRIGQAGSVPMDVSRQHLSLTSLSDGRWQLRNLNNQNVTFVNRIAVESKTITEDDKVELGQSHYLFPWEAVRAPKVETVDITPLRYVWERYNTTSLELRKRQKNIGVLTSIPIGFTMLGGLLSGIASEEMKPFAYVFTGVAFIIMCYSLYRRSTDDSIEEQERLKKEFQRNYVCPKCGHFMGYQDYDLLIQNDACPYCKRKYKK